jgi:hypothetical protein
MVYLMLVWQIWLKWKRWFLCYRMITMSKFLMNRFRAYLSKFMSEKSIFWVIDSGSITIHILYYTVFLWKLPSFKKTTSITRLQTSKQLAWTLPNYKYILFLTKMYQMNCNSCLWLLLYVDSPAEITIEDTCCSLWWWMLCFWVSHLPLLLQLSTVNAELFLKSMYNMGYLSALSVDYRKFVLHYFRQLQRK